MNYTTSYEKHEFFDLQNENFWCGSYQIKMAVSIQRNSEILFVRPLYENLPE